MDAESHILRVTDNGEHNDMNLDGIVSHSAVSTLLYDVGHQMFSAMDRIADRPVDCYEYNYMDNTCSHLPDQSNSLKMQDGKSLPFKCDECHRSFSTRRYLKTHKRIHAGDRCYVCDICNKSFTLQNYLTRHKRKHNGQKPYTCYVCNRVFTELGHLTAHIRIHTGEKPHVCDICGKAFTNSSTLISDQPPPHSQRG